MSQHRRDVLKMGLAAGGGLLLAFTMPGLGGRRARAGDADVPGPAPAAFIRIGEDGAITLIMPDAECGQGIWTSAAMLLAEELEVGLDQVKLMPAPPDARLYASPALEEQATGGSTSIIGDWERLRQAGARARIMLVQAAANRWHVDPATCHAAAGIVHHDASRRAIPYAALAKSAGALPVPGRVALKEPADWTLIGRSQRRLDTPGKVNGTTIYGIDVQVPGLKVGTVSASPVLGGRLLGIDEGAARRVPGVRDVVRFDDVVAVIGDHFWAARQGLEAANLRWEDGPNAHVNTAALVQALARATEQPGVVARSDNDAPGKIAAAPRRVDAIYELPFLSHAPMEPINTTLHIRPDGAELWVGTQVPVRARDAVAKAAGLQPEQVVVHNHVMGGAFGRRLDVDSIEQAGRIAKSLGYPVKLIWTREEDISHDLFRPTYYDRLSAGLDASGRIVGWTHKTGGSSVMARWLPEGMKGALDPDAVEGAAETPYDLPAVKVEYVRHEHPGVTTAWWRGVGPTHNVFVVESFMDECAAAAGQDPIAYRRTMLQKNPRALAVLNLAAEKSGWGGALPPGHGRGVSLQYAFSSFLAHVLEIEVTARGEIVLKRCTVAVDCGQRVNPDTVASQIEGGLCFGLGTALYSGITHENGRVQQNNFNNYRMMRIDEAPLIDVHQVESTEHPGGIGETGTAASAAALGNAIFAATGKRLRKMPFGLGALQKRMIRFLILAMALLGASVTAHAATDTNTVARGEYLTRMADCAACHVGAGGALSGGRAFRTPFGTIHATNITPDAANGIGSYSDDEWIAAMQRGIGRGGKHLYPAMPYTNYTLMSRDDALAIKAYVMTLPAAPDASPANDMHFPFNIRFLMVFWNLLYNPDHRFVPDTAHDAAWNRGAYVAEALGHCQQCHTPRNFLQGLKAGQAYAGAIQQGWNAYNITADPQSGVGGWSEPDLAAYLASGHAEGHGVAAGPMAEAVSYSLRYLTAADAGALAHYLKAVPAIHTPVAVPDSHLAQEALGAHIYEGACASCHRTNGTGSQSPYAALAGDPTAADPAGTNLLQIVLHGGKLSTNDGVFAMPGFAGGYTDAELAAVTNYTIAQFGQHAGQVSAGTVAGVRSGGL